MNDELAGAAWFKSTYSSNAGECVEVAWLGCSRVGVRDSKNPAGPTLAFSMNDWAAFTATLRCGPSVSY
ncbi:DUF397 domain-containing protein [Nocardia flavorosea]|uniref:DUF397 domain-containing protein n=1 Tax=Nocardia flavorosea TaxID=53429 RepID=UPI00189398B1|nr:DUF397 domain-containing protein [Nocardia flavorosea]MBF6351509.1 DUF397 domain-containing protein [Nocardia flavorosea]